MDFTFPIEQGTLHVEYVKKKAGAPTIVFLHDALGAVQTWRAFPERLAERTDCNYLAYDRQGHGKSSKLTQQRDLDYLEVEARVLLDLLEEFAIGRAILFGHSDGGSIALIAAAQLQNKLLGVITEAAHLFVEPLTLAGIKEAKGSYAKGKLRAKLVRYHGTKTDDLFYAWADTWLADDFKDWNIEHLLPHITCPCLAMQGKDDQFGSVKQLQSIKNTHERNTIKLLDNIGHNPHKEQPHLVLELAADFIKNLKQR
ncbi:MAG: alpha/beta hydrolase [Bacteroidota bacterium]